MTQSKIQSVQIPPVTREFAQRLKEVFRPIQIKPGTSQDEIFYSAGQQAVIDFVMRHSVDRVVTGDPEQLRDAKQDTTADDNWLRRALKGKK